MLIEKESNDHKWLSTIHLFACPSVDERRDALHSRDDLVAMTSRPIHPPAAGATTETGRSRQDMGWYNFFHILPGDILEFTVALAAPGVLQRRAGMELEPPKDLDQLLIEFLGPDEHRPRSNGRQLAVPGQEPPALRSRLIREHTILRTGFEKHGVVAKEP
jgi:hypothetical protein